MDRMAVSASRLETLVRMYVRTYVGYSHKIDDWTQTHLHTYHPHECMHTHTHTHTHVCMHAHSRPALNCAEKEIELHTTRIRAEKQY